MSLKNIYASLLPKMGKYGTYTLPMSFANYKTKDLVINTRKPGYTTVFDVSHMGIFETNFKNSHAIEDMLKIDLGKLALNKSKLAVILQENNIIDDLLIGNVDNKKLRLVVNANTKEYFREKDFLNEKSKIIISLQGDGSQTIMEQFAKEDLNNFYFLENKTINDDIEICRCGYTGEDGFEIYTNNEIGESLFEELIHLSNSNDKILFGGLIARDILRLEAGLNLSGAEFGFNEEDKIHDHIQNRKVNFGSLGMNFLIDKKFRTDLNLDSSLTQIKISSTSPIKKGKIYVQNKNEISDVGFITSSLKSFNFNKFIGLGYVDKNYINDTIFIEGYKGAKNILTIEEKFVNKNYYYK